MISEYFLGVSPILALIIYMRTRSAHIAKYSEILRYSDPDAGGNHEEMVAINNAAAWLRARVRAEISQLKAA